MMITQKKRSFFDNLAAAWHENNILSGRERGLLAEVLPARELSRGGVVLDLGGGTGRLADYLTEIYPLRCLVLDISHGMLTEGARHCSRSEIKRIQGDARSLPLSDRSIRFIVSFCSFPHFDLKTEVLRECRRVLVPGGMIMVFHARGREETNHFHAGQSGIIAGDHLPPLEQFRQWGRELKLIAEYQQDRPDSFLVGYRKPAV